MYWASRRVRERRTLPFTDPTKAAANALGSRRRQGVPAR